MSNFKIIPKETKDQILSRIKNNGETVVALAQEYGVSDKTIYYWLRKKTISSVSFLEHARLKRENKLLLELVGRLTLEQKVKKSELLKELMSTQHIAIIKQTKTALARKLGVSRGMLYYQHKRPLFDESLKRDIEKVMKVHKAYGHKRIAIELHINKKRILRVMKKFHLKPIKRRGKNFIKPLDMRKPKTSFKNEIERICPIRTNIVWVGDFTHIKFQDTWVYLATVMDLYTREIIGWHLSTTHTQDLIMHAFQDALENRKTTPLYFHSDQGSEYDSSQHVELLKRNNIIVSMSRKSHPWENGYQESFYSQFKLELGETNECHSLGELYETHAVTLHYYNTKRIHTTLKTSPLQFRLSREYLFNKLGT